MKYSSFVHLHTHSDYSLLDGANSISGLIKSCNNFKMQALAITDHGNVFNAINFYQEAIKNGVKPIIGCEVYVAPGSRFERNTSHGISEAAYHLTLLVKNQQGYKNLLKLVSLAYLEGFYYRPRIDKELLSKHNQGLIALSGCLKGEIAQNILKDDLEQARMSLFEYTTILGKDNFYLELQNHGLDEETKINKELINLAQKEQVELVGTNDCHYLKKEDAFAHEVLMCIGTGKKITDADRLRFSTEEFYFKSPQEMLKIFNEVPSALKNTLVIAEKCNLELNFSQVALPTFNVPKDYSLDSYLEKLCEDGLKARYQQITPQLKQRLAHELKIIKDMGYAAYFLIVWDFIQYAKNRLIPVGPGRGSGAGSLVAYVLGITDIDPLRYGLIFERFLNSERISMPDLDIDFSVEGREEVIKYVREKYGEQNVAQIITFGTLGARAVVRDVARVLDIPLDEADRIAKLIPPDPKMTLADAIKMTPELKDLIAKDDRIKRLFQISHTLEGLSRHISKHAAGIVVAKDDLTNYVPFCKTVKGDITTQYDGESLVKMGLLKVDFLGLKTLNVIKEAVDMVYQNRHIKIDISKIPLDDTKTYALLSKGQNLGVFQLDSAGMRDLSKKIRPTSLEDIIALIALYRPGPMGSGMLDEYVSRKHGKISLKYDHILLTPILKETYGVIVYQEQVMQIAMDLAGFTPGQADILRQAMGKKIQEEIEKQRKPFLEGAVKKGIKLELAAKIFDQMEKFGGYGFNKSHATAYAYLAYQTAYLKANYPLEFMSALLTSEIGDIDDIVLYINECKDMGMKILPPDINESYATFVVENEAIRFGMAAVKNVGMGAIESIIQARQSHGKFTSLYDFCKRVDWHSINKRVMESLIKCGAFDSLGEKRAFIFENLENTMQKAQVLQRDFLAGQTSFLELIPIEENKEQVLTHIKEWPENKLLEYEKEVLGFYITGHPLAKYAEELKNYTNITIKDLEKANDGQNVRVGGIIKKVKHAHTKSGERMAVFELEDLKGDIPVVVFPSKYNGQTASLVKQDAVVVVNGQFSRRREEPQIFLDKIIPVEEVRGELTSSIHINIKTAGLEEEILNNLREIFIKHKGNCSIFIHLATSHHGEIVVSPDFNMKVAPSQELLNEIEALLGKGTVDFKST